MRCLPLIQVIITIAVLQLSASCKKYQDEPGQSDPRLTRKYCNDPEAVNYNLDFPGTADNSVCYYPADVFSGSYAFVDTVYNGGNQLVRQDSLILRLSALSRSRLSIAGFCAGGNDSLRFTVNRQLRASADTTVLKGQFLCREKDTVSGLLTRSLGDSSRMRVFLTVISDTGITSHTGIAYKR